MARILLAEDEPAVREFVTRALQAAKHEVVAVSDGMEALQVLESSPLGDEPFDLLLTDIVMPHLDGIALALKVTRDHPDIRVLMITGYPNERQRAHNLDFLAHEVVAKPFTVDQICTAVKKVLTLDEERD
jgi:CheY-like chemotaxis protein